MDITIVTFNLEYNSGFPKLLRVLGTYKPDIVALQEFLMSDDALFILKKKGYELASHSENFKKGKVYSVATFYKKSSLHVSTTSTIFLPRGAYELVQMLVKGISRRSVVFTEFVVQDRKISVFNVHFSPFTSNNLRNKQLSKTFSHAGASKQPVIVLGDFNYPYNRSNLEKLIEKSGFNEATTNIFHTFYKTFQFLPIKFKLDYILYKNITNGDTKRIDAFTTDHTPIIATFHL